jgi:hypothetical protein
MSPNIGQSKQIKMEIKKSIVESQKKEMEAIYQKLNIEMQRAVLVAQEKSASVFLTALPLKRHNFDLSKTEFTDTLLMRYRWPLPNLPSICPCGEQFSLDHSQICHTGGFINMRHNEVRDLIAHEMKEILKDVESEPHLTPLTGEAIHMRSANVENDARSDIRARGFWAKQQNAFFDVRVFYPHARSYSSRSLSSLFTLFEQEKKRAYADRINQVEHGSFTPLVFSCCGGMGQETTQAIKKLATMLAEKRKEKYNHTITLLRLRISFGILRSALVCLRGSRRKRLPLPNAMPSDVILSEAHASF